MDGEVMGGDIIMLWQRVDGGGVYKTILIISVDGECVLVAPQSDTISCNNRNHTWEFRYHSLEPPKPYNDT